MSRTLAHNSLAACVKAALNKTDMKALGEACGGLPKNYVFRASLSVEEAQRGNDGAGYSPVIPNNLLTLMDGLGLVFANGYSAPWYDAAMEAVNRDDGISAAKRVAIMSMLTVLDSLEID